LARSVSPYLDTLDTLILDTNLAAAILPLLAENLPPGLRRVECHRCSRANAVIKALSLFPPGPPLPNWSSEIAGSARWL
jgi:hypothetical protein